MIAYFAGEFVTAFICAKMKFRSAGRHLWKRTIGSTIFGEGIDSVLFYPLAFHGTGIIPNENLAQMTPSQWLPKVGVEVPSRR